MHGGSSAHSFPTHQCLTSLRCEDFIYLPMDPRSRSSRGFAFVNLTTVESAHRFYRGLNAASPSGNFREMTRSDIRPVPTGIFHGNFLKNYPSETPLEARLLVS